MKRPEHMTRLELWQEVDRLRAALQPFVAIADSCDGINWVPDACPMVASPSAGIGMRPTVGDCRRARSIIDTLIGHERGNMMNYTDYYKEHLTDKPEKLEWHQWFAWFPVPISRKHWWKWAWLTRVERINIVTFFYEGWLWKKIGADEKEAGGICTFDF